MTQDTRKDPRAKIVSLNVRYKSATVDEFIENHSYDVSKGGVFIKTPNAFPPGTLLKFEIRIAGDKAVIVGVGRVVWKREAALGGAERPAGMGVKFIKIDDSSRSLIDKLVAAKPEAGRAFEIEQPQEGLPEIGHATARGIGAAKPVSTAPGGDRKQTMMGMGHLPGFDAATAAAAGFQTGTDDQDLPAAVPKTAAQKFGPAPTASAARLDPAKRNMKSTLVGLPPPDIGGAFPPAGESASSPRSPQSTSGSGAGMFPGAGPNTAPAGPAKEQTVMKQAAELLEEALKEAGGSMDEIGHNPLFSGSAAEKPSKAPEGSGANRAPVAPAPTPAPAAAATRGAAQAKTPIPMEEARPSANVQIREPSSASAMAKSVPTGGDPFASPTKPAVERPSAAKAAPSTRPAKAVDASEDTVRRSPPRGDSTTRTKLAPAAPKKSNTGAILFAAVIVLGAVGGGLYKKHMDQQAAMTSPTPPPPVASAVVAPPAVTPPPVVTAAPSATASAAPAASVTAAAAAASAKAAASASAAAAAAAGKAVPVVAPTVEKPAPVVVEKPAPKPPAPVAVEKPTPPAPPIVKPTPPIAPKPASEKPAPKPKAPADDSDNPY